MAGFVVEENDNLEIAAIATGTKCVTGKPSKRFNVITDCHAEVLAKRGFKRYLMARFDSPDFDRRQQSFDVHLFVTQLPCGTVERYQGPSRKGR